MNTTEHSDQKRFALIEGEFSAEDAREILMELLANKLSFHTKRNFSSEIRFKKQDEFSVQRIQELEKTQRTVLAILKEGAGETFRINCQIELEAIDRNEAATPSSSTTEKVQ